MKRSLFKALLFISPILIVMIGLEIFYQNAPNTYTYKRDYMQRHGDDIEVLILGSSHPYYALDPDYFSDHTFNLSNISQPIYFDKLLFDHYIDSLPKLQKVILCIEYTNLSQEFTMNSDFFRKYYYKQYMDLEVPIVSDYDPRSYMLCTTRNLQWTINLLDLYFQEKNLVTCNGKGWGTDYKVPKTKLDPKVAAQRAKAHEDQSMDFEENIQKINEMIAVCKIKNIEMIIVSTPQTEWYLKNLNQQKLAKVIETCESFANRNPKHVRYLNLFRDKRFTGSDYYDADHLNASGAKKCSHMVNTFIHEND